MTPQLAAADRAAAVRAAARSWRRAGAIDAAALAAIEGRFPDDRVRVGPAFRVLLFLFTVIAVCGAFGFIAMAVLGGAGHEGVLAGLALAAGAALLALTEHQVGGRRRRQGGTEAATSLLGIAFLLSGVAWILLSPASLDIRDTVPVLCLIGAALATGAAWRWGYPLYAAAAAAALLVALARLPAGRALWLALPLAAAPALLRFSESPRLPPAHRSSAMAALLVALAGLYAAVHVGSWDARLIEALGGREAAAHPASYPPPSPLSPSPAHAGWLWWAAVAATALLPILLLALGIRRRRLPLLLAGAAAAAVSLATLCVYVHLGPAWLVLIAAGALAIAAALALWRFLDAGAGEERAGFTAAPLLTDPRRQQLLEAGAAILTLSPEARAPGGEPGFAGGGGRAGGGGASGEF